MMLSYIDLFKDGQRRNIRASVTTDHPASHYGQPVIVLNDGGSLDLTSWVLLNYRVEKATQKERVALEKVFANFELMCRETKKKEPDENRTNI